MIKENNKKNLVWRQGVTWLFVILLSGSFLFGGNVFAFGDYHKLPTGTLNADEWNNLVNDFLTTSGGQINGPVGINTATSSLYALDVNGTIHSTTFIGSYTGTLGAPNVSSGEFAANTGGGNFSFGVVNPGNVGIGIINPAARLAVQATSTNDIINLFDNTGGEKMTVLNSGNVGIGAIAPGEKLSVEGAGTANENVVRFNNQGNFASRIWLRNSAQSAYFSLGGSTADTLATGLLTQSLSFGVGNDSPIQFWNGLTPTVKMTIGSTGNVGIGTTNPGAKLVVSGDNGSPNTNSLAVFGDAILMGTGVNRARVMLGNTDGISELLLAQDSTHGLLFNWAYNATAANAFGTLETYGGNNPLVLQSAGGNVGIGTTSPAYKLDVYGAASFNNNQIHGVGTPTADTDAANVAYVKAVAAGTSTVPTVGYWTASGTNIYNANSGNVGIGTNSPNALLSLGAGVTAQKLLLFESGNARGGFGIQNGEIRNFIWDSAPNGFTFGTVSAVDGSTWSEKLRITPAGYVGIGTTGPQGSLDVAGQGYFGTGVKSPVYSGTLNIYNPANTQTDIYLSQSGSGSSRIGYKANDTNLYFVNAWSTGTMADTHFMALDKSGNLGIGTTNSTYKLDVRGTTASYFDQPVFVGTPTANGHAVTKSYVDSAVTSASLWTVNGTNIYNANSGNVGIGNSGGTVKLKVSGDIESTNTVRGTGGFAGTATGPGAELGVVGGNAYFSGYDRSGSYVPTRFMGSTIDIRHSDAKSDIYVNSTGNVGINTNSPTLANLQIQGSVFATGVDGIFMALDNASTPRIGFTKKFGYNPMLVHSNNMNFSIGMTDNTSVDPAGFSTISQQLVIDTLGKVGIGTASPSYLLDVRGSTASYFDQPVFVGTPTANGHAATKSYVDSLLTGGSGSTVGYWTMSGSNIYNTNSGNLGIGTANPGAYKLNVNGDTNITGALNVTGAITGGAALTGTLNAANISSGAFASNTGGGNFSFPGNIGIGINSPLSKLVVNTAANTDFEVRNGADYGAGYSGVAIDSRDDTRSTRNMMIIAGSSVLIPFGNVGIGTTNPGSKLEVAGDILFGTTTNTGRIKSNGTDTLLDAIPVGGAVILRSGGAVEGMRLSSAGNVGIGTTDPSEAKLVINAGAGLALKAYGNGIFTGTLQTQTGSDFAEEFATTKDLEMGTVVVMDDAGYKSVRPCTKSYDKTVVGIVSNNPSIIAGRITSEHKAIIAMMGVVKVKVTDINGGVGKGDLLTTSGIKGYAMKATDSKPGTVIGKALEDLSGAYGEINVLVNLQ